LYRLGRGLRLVGPIAEILMRRYKEVGGKGALFFAALSLSAHESALAA
jgi:hypothetical protein